MVALYRPGPLEFIPTYIRRMHGEEKVDFRHPSLEPIFQETYGIPVYQEQIMRAAVDIAGYTMSESDELRKAISKKQKDKLEKHKSKFIQGAVARGIMDQPTAEAIFNDWEEFARYGFNKSHAADYGVISVQTAYLKAHFTVEYMTALLSAEKNDTAKVAFYVADCRSMGIEVLPPDVNTCGWDFTIEDRQDQKSAIRFGLGAIKNVGQSPVELILQAVKDGGTFSNLNDFIQRVDLRTVGKRALESLIKVGALDSLGTRVALLEALDQMLSVSASHFKAASSGQLSFFGSFSEAVDEIVLPFAASLDTREQLEWERDLLGLYVSAHPLTPYLPALRRKITHFSGTLGEVHNKEKVTVAGMVTRFRLHQTKGGKAMGFATIEDIQGPVELVLFPRTWEKYEKLLVPDRILIAEGKVDAEGGDPKLLVDRLEELNLEEAMLVPDIPSIDMSAYVPPAVAAVYGGTAYGEPLNDDEDVESPPSGPRISETRPRYVSPESIEDDGVPPVPDDWHLFEPPAEDDYFVTANQTPPEMKVSPVPPQPMPAAQAARPLAAAPNTPPKANHPAPNPSSPPAAQAGEPLPHASSEQSKPAGRIGPGENQASPFLAMPFFVLPASMPGTVTPNQADADKFEAENENPARMLTIILRSSSDKPRDVRRLKRIHGMLLSYPGHDKFSLMVFEGGRRFLLEFPNETTGICSELIRKLIEMVGEGNVTVEPIKIQ